MIYVQIVKCEDCERISQISYTWGNTFECPYCRSARVTYIYSVAVTLKNEERADESQ